MMNKVIHIISDLHLMEDEPHLFNLFEYYMQSIANDSNELYVLGDLFEVWVGDDNDISFNRKVIALFAEYSHSGKALYFCHGNRDFLLGEEFAKQCGGQIIEEPRKLRWMDKTIALMHGDSLCTDDIDYQQFRSMVRDPQWQQQFLSQPLAARLAYAADVRSKSKDSQQNKTAEIMDVNKEAVFSFMGKDKCDWLIHGHTHREGKHEYSINGRSVNRVVLADWKEKGHYLELKQNEINSLYFAI